jgi:predicted unusual protein kinase regulating ubiquinone biosynthesis (AarF/ABC1/UbiB family)
MSEMSEPQGLLIGRAARIGKVLAKHGLDEVFSRSQEPDDVARARARRVRDALDELGPTFAKLGQILSTRPDLLPPEMIEELSTLQERVTPLTEAEVVSVMERELGVPWEDVFASIEPTPLAAGTIGQAHRGTLESGARVVTKVQRPTAEQDILADLGLLELFAERASERPTLRQVVDIPAVIEHLAESLRRELDFRQEAANVDRMQEVLAPYPRLGVPRIYHELSTARLLVMEEIEGVPLREAPPGPERTEAARQLLESYYHQILTAGFFHADPHPGNMKWWKDSIYLLDFGMVGEIPPETRELLVLLLMAFWREDTSFLADVMLMLAGEEQRGDVDVEAIERELAALVGGVQGQSLQEIQLGPLLQGMTEIAARNDIRLPASLALTGKALAQMQLAAGELDPSLDPLSVAGGYLLRDLTRKARGIFDPKRLLYDAQKVRARVVRFGEAIERLAGSRPGPKLQVNITGTERLEETIKRSTRRLSLAVTAGAFIVAAGFTASSGDVGSWLPILFGVLGGLLTASLILDLAFGRR